MFRSLRFYLALATGVLTVLTFVTLGWGQLYPDPVPLRKALTDRSGSITTGGTAQTMMAANASRCYLLIQNVSAGDLWINFGTTAVQDSPSIRISPNSGSFVWESTVAPSDSVSVIGATTGQKWTAKEAC